MARSGVSLQLAGADSLRDALQRLPASVAKRVETAGCRKGAVALRRKLRASAPRGATGQLRKAIRYRRIKYRKKSGLVGYKLYAAGFHERLGSADSAIVEGYKLGSGKVSSGRGRSFIANVALLRMFEYGSAGRPGFPRKPFWNRIVAANKSKTAGIMIDAMDDAVYVEAGKAFARQNRRASRRT